MVRLDPDTRVDGKIEPAVDVELVTAGQAFSTRSPARALWIGTAGTITFVTKNGTLITDFPAKEGILPIQVSSVVSLGTAANVWALF